MSNKPIQDSMSQLLDGVLQFEQNVFPQQQAEFARLAQGQAPHTLFIACADSRVVPERITQTQPGELFVCRNIGNIVPAYGDMPGGVAAVIEFAVVALGVSHIVVCGHSGCGAMQALARPDDAVVRMPMVASWLRNAAAAQSVVQALHPDLKGEAAVNALAEQNLRVQLGHLRTHPSVAAKLAVGGLKLHAWLYDIAAGRVDIVDEVTGERFPASEAARRLREVG